MATLNEIIYDIRGLIRDAKSDDLHFTDRQIAFWIKTLRTKLIKERLDKGQVISTNNYQTLENVVVTPEQPYTGTSIDIDLDCPVIRSPKLPTILQDNGKPLIDYVRGLNIFSKIPVMCKSQAIRIKNNKYTKNMMVAFLENDYLYILANNNYIENIAIEALFENPEDAHEYNTGEPLDFNSHYPLDQNLIDTIKQLIITNNLALYIRLPEDRDNDAETAY